MSQLERRGETHYVKLNESCNLKVIASDAPLPNTIKELEPMVVQVVFQAGGLHPTTIKLRRGVMLAEPSLRWW